MMLTLHIKVTKYDSVLRVIVVGSNWHQNCNFKGLALPLLITKG